MPRVLRVFSLALAFYLAGLLVLALGTASLVSLGFAGLASPLIAVGLAILLVAAPVVAGEIVPGARRRVIPSCPHCGASLAQPVIESPMIW